MSPPTLNLIEPPWYGPVCPVVWEGWHREVSPYPDQSASRLSGACYSLIDSYQCNLDFIRFGTAVARLNITLSKNREGMALMMDILPESSGPAGSGGGCSPSTPSTGQAVPHGGLAPGRLWSMRRKREGLLGLLRFHYLATSDLPPVVAQDKRACYVGLTAAN